MGRAALAHILRQAPHEGAPPSAPRLVLSEVEDMRPLGSWNYHGLVKIDLQISSPSKEITLNSNEIEVNKAEILQKDGIEI